MKKIIRVEIDIPLVPNFIRHTDNTQVVPIQEFTEEELREIGEEWTRNLIRAAKIKRLPD